MRLAWFYVITLLIEEIVAHITCIDGYSLIIYHDIVACAIRLNKLNAVIIFQFKQIVDSDIVTLAKGNGKIIQVYTNRGVHFANINAIVGRASCQQQATCKEAA